MAGFSVSDDDACRLLRLWGLACCVGGPKGLPRQSAHVYVPRGVDIEWTSHEVDLVGSIVQRLDVDERAVVKLYFEPQASGKRLTVNAISKIMSMHHKIINRMLDRCIGRVAGELSVLSIDVI